MLRGRQIAWMLKEHLRYNEVDGSIYQLQDLFNTKLRGDNLVDFITRWDRVLQGMRERPADAVLEALFDTQIRSSQQFHGTYALYEQETVYNDKEKSYEKLIRSYNQLL